MLATMGTWHGTVVVAGLLAALVSACGSDSTKPEPSENATGGTGGSTTPPSSSGGQGGSGGEPLPPEEEPDGPPRWLSETSLFAEDGTSLGPGVEPFEPRFPLWTDGAGKRRWIYLPPGAVIDTSDPDRWEFPPGTRLWKEFTRDDVRVETRLLERRPDGSWWMVAYQWNEEQMDAEARPEGVQNASGTDHDIPSTEDCRTCHAQSKARVLGFGFLQLAHDGDGVTLAQLLDEGKLSEPLESMPEIPGSEEEQKLLGALHANCGHCHQPGSRVSLRTPLELWLPLGEYAGIEDTPFSRTTVDKAVTLPADSPEGTTVHIDPGSPDTSALFLRASSRGTEYQMPPLGTELADPDFVELLEAWITSLQQ